MFLVARALATVGSVSVQEVHSVRVRGYEDGFFAAQKLASRVGATLRWAALWLDLDTPERRARRAALVAHFGPRLAAVPPADPASATVCVVSPTRDDMDALVAHAEGLAFTAHFSPPLYEGDHGPDAPWIAFVDPEGYLRDDARVYRIELACNAVPLTTSGDRPHDPGFGYGPAPASGWALRLVTIRDHMPRHDLARWLADAMGVPADAVSAGD